MSIALTQEVLLAQTSLLPPEPAWTWQPPPWMPEGLSAHLWSITVSMLVPALLTVALAPRALRWRQAYRRGATALALLLMQAYALLLAASVLTTWPTNAWVTVTVFALAAALVWWQGLRLTRSHTIVTLGVSCCVLATAYLLSALTGAAREGLATNRFSTVITLVCGFVAYLAGMALLHGMRGLRFTLALVVMALTCAALATWLSYHRATYTGVALAALGSVCLVGALLWGAGRRQWALAMLTFSFVAASLTLALTGRSVSAFTAGLCALATGLSLLAVRCATAGSAAVASLAWSAGLVVLTAQYLWTTNSPLVVPVALSSAATGIGGLAMLIYGGDRLRRQSLTGLINHCLDWLGRGSPTCPAIAVTQPVPAIAGSTLTASSLAAATPAASDDPMRALIDLTGHHSPVSSP